MLSNKSKSNSSAFISAVYSLDELTVTNRNKVSGEMVI